MSRLSEEIQNRYAKRHKNKVFTWANFLVRLILLILVIMFIRFLADPDTGKFRDFIFGGKSNNVKIENTNSE